MKTKKWLGLLLIIVIITTWFVLFYKTYSERYVAYNADHVICIDIKKITQAIVWNYITTPSEWKKISSGKKKKSEAGWKDLIRLPDYAFIFHIKGQPANAWYTILDIKNPKRFVKDAAKLSFKKIAGTQRYISSSLGIEFIQSGDQLLIANAAVKDKNLIVRVAADLFESGKHTERRRLAENINAEAHLSWQYFGNSSVKAAHGVVNIDGDKIVSKLNVMLNNQPVIQQKIFQVSDSALLSLAMIRPPAPVYNLIPQNLKISLSRLINFNIDSLCQPGIDYWQSEVNAITQKADTAITYDYDEDFNPVEKKVINTVTEPDFSLSFYGTDVNSLYRYWKDSAVLQSTEQGVLFTPMPLVKTYAFLNGNNELKLQSTTFKSDATRQKSEACILYTSVNLQRLPDSLMNYAPKSISPFLKKLASATLTVESKTPGNITLNAVLKKKKQRSWYSSHLPE